MACQGFRAFPVASPAVGTVGTLRAVARIAAWPAAHHGGRRIAIAAYTGNPYIGLGIRRSEGCGEPAQTRPSPTAWRGRGCGRKGIRHGA